MALTCFEIELDTFKCSPLIAIEACQPYFGDNKSAWPDIEKLQDSNDKK